MLDTASTRLPIDVRTSSVASPAIDATVCSLTIRGRSTDIMPAVAEQVWPKAAFAVTAWLCLCHLPVAVCWSCSLTMTGDRDRPQNLSLAQTTLHCNPGSGDVGTVLPVGFSNKLTNRSLQGRLCDLSFVAKNVAAVGKQPPGELALRSTSVHHNADTLLHGCRCSSLCSSCWAQ